MLNNTKLSMKHGVEQARYLKKKVKKQGNGDKENAHSVTVNGVKGEEGGSK